jgi:hypothetical protein
MPTTHFQSITQYDKQFDNEIDKIICGKGYACSFFGILTPWKFMQGQIPDKKTHEQTIKDSVQTSRLLDMSNGLTFSELLENYTNLDANKITGTCVELIVSKVLGFDEMFPKIKDTEKYSVVFLKNEKYIVVMVDKNGYYLRDCHEATQHDFTDISALMEHLNTSYQFGTSINIEGLEYSEYSSVEFLRIEKEFTTNLSSMMSLGAKPIDDIFDMPNDVMLTPDEIKYLEMLNEQLNGFGTCEDDDPDAYKSTEFTKITGDVSAEFIHFD